MCLGLLAEETIYEALIGTRGGLLKPLGLWRQGDTITVRIYSPSPLLRDLARQGVALASFTDDALEFYSSLIEGRGGCRGPGGLPMACRASSAMLLELAETLPGNPALLRFRPRKCFIHGAPLTRPYTRANALLLEMLIHYTRLEPYMAGGMGPRVFSLIRLIETHASTISRVAPGSEYDRAARHIVDRARRLLSHML